MLCDSKNDYLMPKITSWFSDWLMDFCMESQKR